MTSTYESTGLATSGVLARVSTYRIPVNTYLEFTVWGGKGGARGLRSISPRRHSTVPLQSLTALQFVHYRWFTWTSLCFIAL